MHLALRQQLNTLQALQHLSPCTSQPTQDHYVCVTDHTLLALLTTVHARPTHTYLVLSYHTTKPAAMQQALLQKDTMVATPKHDPHTQEQAASPGSCSGSSHCDVRSWDSYPLLSLLGVPLTAGSTPREHVTAAQCKCVRTQQRWNKKVEYSRPCACHFQKLCRRMTAARQPAFKPCALMAHATNEPT